jgi:quercetin dioxygenase-like cupin family protein
MATQLGSAPYALAAGDGEQLVWFDATITRKASDPGIGVIECTISAGEEPPLHVHAGEDEWFYLLDGEVTFHVGGEDLRGSTGSFVSFPRGIPHTFTVESGTARFLILNTPGGFERMFELAPKTVAEAVEAMTRFGMEIVGPHPREAAEA